MNVVIYDSEDSVAAGAMAHFARAAREAIAERGVFTVALSGGQTPAKLFRLLADGENSDLVDWSRTHVFWADERLAPPDHLDSNYRLARENLLQHVSIPPEQIHRVPAETGKGAAVIYEHHLREVFRALRGKEDWPRFDLVLLGMGADGHTASLMPDVRGDFDPLAWVIEPWVPHLRASRVSLTPGSINHAREVLFLVTGAGKSEAVKAVLEGPLDPKRLPAQRIHPKNGTLTWYLDEEAASRLRASRVA